jgi:hypothetical protein
MADLDPFTEVYDELWKLVESHEPFVELVKPGNRIKFNEQPKLKDQARRADTPEVRLVADAPAIQLFRTSNSHYVQRTYRWEISTNDIRITKVAFPVEWAIVEAMQQARDALAGLSYVKQVRIGNGEPPGPDPEQRTDGWHSVLPVEVEMWLQR